jgi:hypothetical protein
MNLMTTRSYCVFEILEDQFEEGYKLLKSYYANIRHIVPESKYKFEPIYDCLKSMNDEEEVACYMDHQNHDFTREIELINLQNWHAQDEFFG